MAESNDLSYFDNISVTDSEINEYMKLSREERASKRKSNKPPVPNVDPRVDSGMIIAKLAAHHDSCPMNKTTLMHYMSDGRTIEIWKDKNGNLWYRWKGGEKRFSQYHRIGS